MSIIFLVSIGLVVLLIPAAFLLFPNSWFPRILAALALMAIIAFSVFGFFASYEYSEVSRRLPWQIGYTVIGLVCVTGIVMLLRPRRHSKREDSSNASR